MYPVLSGKHQERIVHLIAKLFIDFKLGAKLISGVTANRRPDRCTDGSARNIADNRRAAGKYADRAADRAADPRSPCSIFCSASCYSIPVNVQIGFRGIEPCLLIGIIDGFIFLCFFDSDFLFKIILYTVKAGNK